MSGSSIRNRVRSPRFPSQSLPDSLKHLKAIYNGVHASQIDSDTAFRLMGFAGKSGSSAKALGSLRQYGLIEGVGDKTRVSDLSFAILEPSSPEERAQAILDAATQPDVFADVLTRFDDRIPQADEPIRAFLIRDLGFQKKSADQCIQALRESILFAEGQQTHSDNESVSEQEIVESDRDDAIMAEAPTPGSRDSGSPTELVVIPLTKECRAELRLVGKISDRAVSNLIKHIDLLADVWRETDALD